MDVFPRACTRPFCCLRPVHVYLRHWTWLHVPAPARSSVYDLFTCVYALGRCSVRLFRPLPVSTPCAFVCTPLDVGPRACTGPFRCVRPVHVCVLPWTWLTCLYRRVRPVHVLDVAPRAGTGLFRRVRAVHVCVGPWACLYVPLPAGSQCTACTRVGTVLDVAPRTCTGPFLRVRPVHVCVPARSGM